TGLPVHRHRAWDNAIAYDGHIEGWAHALRKRGHHVAPIGKLHYRGHVDEDYGFTESQAPAEDQTVVAQARTREFSFGIACLSYKLSIDIWCTDLNGRYRQSVKFGEDCVGRLGPHEGLGIIVVFVQIAVDRGLEVDDRTEH